MSDKKQKQPDPDITYQGTSITLPNDPRKMAIPAAIEALERKQKDEMTKLDVHEVIDHHPHDALLAFNWAMKDTYGWASPQAKQTFFGPVAPDMIKVSTGPKDDEFEQVVCGVFKLPNISEPIELHIDFAGSGRLHVTGKVRKADRQYIVDLANKARQYLKVHSIFKSKAFRVPCDEAGEAQFNQIKFIETDYIAVDELILNPDEMAQIDASLWTPIKHTQSCMDHKIPLNRGVLLEGTYGTGKSMTANVTSRVCVDNGWTFILLDDVRALKDALLFAQRYQPCVIFAEDIDRVAEQRDEMGNNILNTIDGILTKNSQVITVLTTNYVEKLDRAMLRPGRLDAVVSIHPPEQDAVKRLIRLYGRELIADNDTLSKSAEVLAGNIPATVREVVERSKLGMISRGDTVIKDDDLYTSAVGMKGHLDLLSSKKDDKSPEHMVGESLKNLLVLNTDELDKHSNLMKNVARSVSNSSDAVRKSVGGVSRAIQEQTGEVTEKLDSVKEDTSALVGRRR